MSGLVAAAFFPHAFVTACSACGSTLDKVIELALYVGVGLLTGTLSGRLNRARNRLQFTLTEKSAMEAELMRSTRMAAVGRLSAGLAHEIRNPLASIQGSAEVLADDYDTAHPKGRMLAILLDEARRLNGVLTRFLEFARSEPGEAGVFDLRLEAEAVAEMIRRHPEFDQVACHVEPAEGAFPAKGNREQIRQVLLNLGLNGAAVSGDDGRVTLGLENGGDFSRCHVTDTGPGFSAEARENFGTPFFSTRPGGTGLGLATSLKIVQDMGGTLEPGEDTGHGGLVTLTLPGA